MRTVFLADTSPLLRDAWAEQFSDCPEIKIIESAFSVSATAIVSPANSYGFMDGGFDYLLTSVLGESVERDVKRVINDIYDGELLVGQAFTQLTNHQLWPYLIVAPTMRVPMVLGPNTINPYLAARAAFLQMRKKEFKSIIITGLGTGVGKVPPQLCASQMKQAYTDVFTGQQAPSTWREAQLRHLGLYTTTTEDLQNP